MNRKDMSINMKKQGTSQNNKLFLIGNGFDIHHGLKTSYLDLLVWIHDNDLETFTSLNKLLERNYLFYNGYDTDYWEKYQPKTDIDLRIDKMNLEEVKKTKAYEYLDKISQDPLILYAIWESLEDYLYYVFLNKELDDVESERESLRQILKDEDYGPVTESDIDILDRPAQEEFDKLKKLAKSFNSDLYLWVESINQEVDHLEWNISSLDEESEENEENIQCISLLPGNFFLMRI